MKFVVPIFPSELVIPILCFASCPIRMKTIASSPSTFELLPLEGILSCLLEGIFVHSFVGRPLSSPLNSIVQRYVLQARSTCSTAGDGPSVLDGSWEVALALSWAAQSNLVLQEKVGAQRCCILVQACSAVSLGLGHSSWQLWGPPVGRKTLEMVDEDLIVLVHSPKSMILEYLAWSYTVHFEPRASVQCRKHLSNPIPTGGCRELAVWEPSWLAEQEAVEAVVYSYPQGDGHPVHGCDW